MTRRKDEHQLQKVTLNLVKGDYARIGALYPELGAGKAIRLIVHAHLQKLTGARNLPEISANELNKFL